MKFRLEDISAKGKKFHYEYGTAEIIKALEERNYSQSRPSAPLQVNIRIHRLERQIFVQGTIDGEMEGLCSRCLEPVKMLVQTKFQQTYLPEPPIAFSGDDEVELSSDDLDTTYYAGEEIDMSPLIWDELILDIPINPLCHHECRGLCLTCGANLNKGKCFCSPVVRYSRWEALRQLKS